MTIQSKQMGRVAALDFGEKRIGVSISDPSRIIATPLGTIILSHNFVETLAELRKILQPYSPIIKFVVGNPLHLDGKTGEMAINAQLFARKIEEAFSLPVEMWDERLSSAQAERSLKDSGMKRKKRVAVADSLAAAIILQSYLDSIPSILSHPK